jgi:hypothetical protein
MTIGRTGSLALRRGLAALPSFSPAASARARTPWEVRFRRPVIHGLVLAGIIVNLYIIANNATRVVWWHDAQSWWTLDLQHLYDRARGDLMATGAFRYAPPLAFVIYPFTLLPWPAFVALYGALELAALVWLSPRRWWLWLIAFPPVMLELHGGNIHLFMAAAVAAGFRHPGAWAFLLLTKVTPAIGLAWFAARRQWAYLGMALAVTVALAAGSLVFAPELWWAWFDMLRGSVGLPAQKDISLLPLAARLPIALAIAAWGGSTGRSWTVPVAAIVAMPTIWVGSLCMLIALERRPQLGLRRSETPHGEPADDPSAARHGSVEATGG